MDDFPNLFDADDFHGLVVEAPRGVRFPAIYSGTRLDDSGPAKHGACLFLADLPPELWSQVNVKTSDFDPDWVYVSAFGAKRPEVVPDTEVLQRLRGMRSSYGPEAYEAELKCLVREAELERLSRLYRLGARNLSTDRLFVETPLRLEIGGFRWGSELHRPPRFMPDRVREALEGKFLLQLERVHILLREGE